MVGTIDLVSPKEAAEMVGMSRSTIYHWIQTGLLPRYKLGTGPFARLRINRADVLKLIRVQQVKSDDEG